MFYTDTVSVTRKSSAGSVSSTGQPILASTIVISSMSCDIQPDNSEYLTPAQGQTVITRKIMFCDIADIQEKDTITDTATSKVYKVTSVKSYTVLLPHMEIKIESGVT